MTRNSQVSGFSFLPKTERGRQIVALIVSIAAIFSLAYAISVATESSTAAHTFVAKYQYIDQTKLKSTHR